MSGPRARCRRAFGSGIVVVVDATLPYEEPTSGLRGGAQELRMPNRGAKKTECGGLLDARSPRRGRVRGLRARAQPS